MEEIIYCVDYLHVVLMDIARWRGWSEFTSYTISPNTEFCDYKSKTQ